LGCTNSDGDVGLPGVGVGVPSGTGGLAVVPFGAIADGDNVAPVVLPGAVVVRLLLVAGVTVPVVFRPDRSIWLTVVEPVCGVVLSPEVVVPSPVVAVGAPGVVVRPLAVVTPGRIAVRTEASVLCVSAEGAMESVCC